jgi:hypothetical protein
MRQTHVFVLGIAAAIPVNARLHPGKRPTSSPVTRAMNAMNAMNRPQQASGTGLAYL